MAYRRIIVDIDKGESRTPEFLALNPNGRVPLLVLSDGTALAESNVILAWLAREAPYFPEAPLSFAQTLQWVFFEQYSHEPNIATVRYWRTHNIEIARLRSRTSTGKGKLPCR